MLWLYAWISRFFLNDGLKESSWQGVRIWFLIHDWCFIAQKFVGANPGDSLLFGTGGLSRLEAATSVLSHTSMFVDPASYFLPETLCWEAEDLCFTRQVTENLFLQVVSISLGGILWNLANSLDWISFVTFRSISILYVWRPATLPLSYPIASKQGPPWKRVHQGKSNPLSLT